MVVFIVTGYYLELIEASSGDEFNKGIVLELGLAGYKQTVDYDVINRSHAH